MSLSDKFSCGNFLDPRKVRVPRQNRKFKSENNTESLNFLCKFFLRTEKVKAVCLQGILVKTTEGGET